MTVGTKLYRSLGCLLVLFSTHFVSQVEAAQLAEIVSDVVEVYDAPSARAAPIETIDRGARVSASSYPTEGFFKIRTPTGKVGWVAESAIRLSGPYVDPSKPSPLGVPGAPGSAPGAVYNGSAPSHDFVRMRGMAGMSFFRADSLNRQLSFRALENGFYYGGEVNFRFSRKFAMLIRFENVLKTIIAKETTSSDNFQIDLSSVPVMAGFEFRLFQKKKWAAHLGFAAGLGINTSLKSTATTLPGPNNITYFRGYSFTTLTRLTVDYEMFKKIHFFLEGGYRWLKSAPLLPEIEGSGNSIWQDAGGNNVPMTIDLSGPFGGLGISLLF